MDIEQLNRLCDETLGTYIANRIWTSPQSEFRENIRPLLVNEMSAVGVVHYNDTTIALPTSLDPYYVWGIPTEVINIGMHIPTGTWISTDTLLNKYRTNIDFYSILGTMFHKGQVYVRLNAGKTILLFAVSKPVVRLCCKERSLQEVYFTVYFDSNLANQMKVLSLHCTRVKEQLNQQNQIDDFLSKVDNPHQVIMYHNGIEVTDVNNPPFIEIGDYVDLIHDKNIVFAFDVDLTTEHEDPTYYSSKDKCWKQLIHIPKELNPDHLIFHRSTCDFFVRKHGQDIVDGRYLYHATIDKAPATITQVTHNDFGIPLYILDAYRDYIGQQEIYVHVVCRLHPDLLDTGINDNITIIPNNEFIHLLYTSEHSDKDITDFLCNKKNDTKISWWSAGHLEKCKYTEMLTHIPQIGLETHITEYAEALGYYHTLSVLCRRIVTATVTDGFTGSYAFRIPVLYRGHAVRPVVFRNHKVLPASSYWYVNEGEYCTIRFGEDIEFAVGSTITVIFYLTNSNTTIYSCKPTSSNLTYEIHQKDIEVYQEMALKEGVDSVGGTSHTAYKLVPANTNQYAVIDYEGGYRIVFNSDISTGNNRFLIYPKGCVYYERYEISNYLATGQTITIRASVTAQDQTQVPLLVFNDVTVFLNGDYLVRGIDYDIVDTKTIDHYVVGYDIVIQSMDHFVDGENYVELVCNTSETQDRSIGFVKDEVLTDTTPAGIYFPSLTAVYVDSGIERDSKDKWTYIQLPPQRYKVGSIFEVQTNLPQYVKDYIDQYTTNTDIERLVIMNKYFSKFRSDTNKVLMLEDKHRIYSVFVNTLLWGIVHGELQIRDEPDEERFLDQFKDYMYLKEHDICFTNIDRNFVDFYPQYVNYEVDLETRQILERVIKTFMPENSNPTMEIVS